MHDTLGAAVTDYISAEEQRLAYICLVADRYKQDRKEKLRGHDQKIRTLKRDQ